MPKIILNLPKQIPETQKYEVNIDFDEASRKWTIHTAADNPRELRRKQRKYWNQVKSRPHRRSKRILTRQEPNMDIIMGYVKDTSPPVELETDPITGIIQRASRRSHRKTKQVKRLIEEL